MSGEVAYLDSSAFVKLIVPEADRRQRGGVQAVP
jgi:hypothetical protein